MRTLTLTAAALAVLALAAPVAAAAPALQYDIAVTSDKADLTTYPNESFTFALTATNLGTATGSAGGVHVPKIKGLKLTASGSGWDCREPAETWAFFCMNFGDLPHGQSLPPITVRGVADGTTSHTFVPVTVDGWRRSEQNHANNQLNVLVTSYDR